MNRDRSFSLVGTAVAVSSSSRDILLTAGHCVKFTDAQYFCALVIPHPFDFNQRPANSFDVDVLAHKLSSPDLAVLRRCDNKKFDTPCPELLRPEQLPWNINPRGWLAQAYVFYVPIEVIDHAHNGEGGSPDVCCDVDPGVALHFPTRHHFRIRGFQRGSSGGAIITSDGQLIGVLSKFQTHGELTLGSVKIHQITMQGGVTFAMDRVPVGERELDDTADAKDACDVVSISAASSYLPETGSTAVIPSTISLRHLGQVVSMCDFLDHDLPQAKQGSVEVVLTEKVGCDK